jgi:hypothetical protein
LCPSSHPQLLKLLLLWGRLQHAIPHLLRLLLLLVPRLPG